MKEYQVVHKVSMDIVTIFVIAFAVIILVVMLIFMLMGSSKPQKQTRDLPIQTPKDSLPKVMSPDQVAQKHEAFVARNKADFKILDDVITENTRLHRLLMIEIINEKSPISVSSETVTFAKMTKDLNSLSRVLMRAVGISRGQKLVDAMQEHNEVLRQYYEEMRNVVCNETECSHIVEVIKSKPRFVKTPFPTVFPAKDVVDSHDVTYITQQKLAAIANKITIALTYGNDKKFFDLVMSYYKGLIDQAKFYATQDFELSMVNSQKSLEISRDIINEIERVMLYSYQMSLPTHDSIQDE